MMRQGKCEEMIVVPGCRTPVCCDDVGGENA